MPYLLDADTFIQAKNRHFAFAFCPAYWDWIIQAHRDGKVFTVEKVRQEIMAGNDELKTWISALPAAFFLKPDEATVPAFTQVSTWVGQQGYQQAAVAKFLTDGDYFLIAHALAHGFTVVTHEESKPTMKRVIIPVVCRALNVTCIDPFRMLTQEGVQFVL